MEAATQVTISYDDALVLVGGLRRLRRAHLECEDSWYSCPLSEEGCADDAQTGCTCGAETQNALVDALLGLIEPATSSAS